MYAWIALSDRLNSIVGMMRDRPLGEEVSIPGWVAEYLFEVTEDLQALAFGRDFRAPPVEIDWGAHPTPEEAINSPEAEEQRARSRVSPDEAMKLVAAALGLTRQGGWNAFGSLASTMDKAQDARSYDALRSQGVPAKIAHHELSVQRGIGDPRHMQRRIAEGRRLMGWSKVAKPEE